MLVAVQCDELTTPVDAQSFADLSRKVSGLIDVEEGKELALTYSAFEMVFTVACESTFSTFCQVMKGAKGIPLLHAVQRPPLRLQSTEDASAPGVLRKNRPSSRQKRQTPVEELSPIRARIQETWESFNIVQQSLNPKTLSPQRKSSPAADFVEVRLPDGTRVKAPFSPSSPPTHADFIANLEQAIGNSLKHAELRYRTPSKKIDIDVDETHDVELLAEAVLQHGAGNVDIFVSFKKSQAKLQKSPKKKITSEID